MQRVVLVICLVMARLSVAQELSPLRKSEMLDCTFHQKGQWVDQKPYRDATAGFTYLLEAAQNEKPNTLYVAFWNPKMTEGKLLVFHLVKNPDHKDAFALVNDGWIHDKQGKLDVEDLLGGVYTYEQIKSKLPRLKKGRKTTAIVDQLQDTDAVCSSPLTKQG